jgi:hypothetical protein
MQIDYLQYNKFLASLPSAEYRQFLAERLTPSFCARDSRGAWWLEWQWERDKLAIVFTYCSKDGMPIRRQFLLQGFVNQFAK